MFNVYIDDLKFEVKEKKVFGDKGKLIIGDNELEVDTCGCKIFLDISDDITIVTLQD